MPKKAIVVFIVVLFMVSFVLSSISLSYSLLLTNDQISFIKTLENNMEISSKGCIIADCFTNQSLTSLEIKTAQLEEKFNIDPKPNHFTSLTISESVGNNTIINGNNCVITDSNDNSVELNLTGLAIESSLQTTNYNNGIIASSGILTIQATTELDNNFTFSVGSFTTIARLALVSPKNGTIVYDLTLNIFFVYQNSSWFELNAGGVASVTGTIGQIDCTGGNNPIISMDPTLFAAIQTWDALQPLTTPVNGQILQYQSSISRLAWISLGTPFTISRTIFVDKSGNDTTGNGTEFFPFLTVTKAIDIAIAGNTSIINPTCIYINAGIYIEPNPILITKSGISLIGQSMRATVLMPLNPNLDFFTMTNQFFYCTQTRFETVTGMSTGSCFVINGTFSNLISSCLIRNFQVGISVTGTSFQTATLAITDCTFAQNNKVLNATSVSFFIDSCQIQGSSTFTNLSTYNGLYFTGSSCLGLVSGCLFTKCGIGVHGDTSTYLLISACNIVYCEIGMEGLSQAILNISACNQAKMDTNHVAYYVTGMGTKLRISSSTIDGRNLSGIIKGIGIVIENEAVVTILSCDLSFCLIGVQIGLVDDSTSTKASIQNSTFSLNTLAIKQQGTTSLNAFLITVDNISTAFSFNSTTNIHVSFSTGDEVWLKIGELVNEEIDILTIASKLIDFPRLLYNPSIYNSESLVFKNPDTIQNSSITNVAELDSNINCISRNISQNCSLRLISDTSSNLGDSTNIRGWEIKKSSTTNAPLGFFYSNDLLSQPIVSDIKKLEIDPVTNSLFLSNLILNWIQNSNLYEVSPNVLKTDGNLIIDGLNPEFAIITNNSNQLISSNTTAVELGYVSGLTSSLQTQLNNKLSLSGGILIGQVSTTYNGSAISPSFLINGGGIYSADLNHFNIATAGLRRIEIDDLGIITFYDFISTGIIHNDANGQLSTSLIVNTDITNTTISNTKLATISSANNASYIVVRDVSGNFESNMITILGITTNPTDVATKQYVDNAVSFEFEVHNPVIVVSTTNIILSGLQTIDSILLIDGDRVLLVNQSSAIENGAWVAHTGAWTRPTDFNIGDPAGTSSFLILEGMVDSGAIFVCSTPSAIINTDPLSFSQFSLPQDPNGVNNGIGQGSIYSSTIGNTLQFRTLLKGDIYMSISNLVNEVSIGTNATNLNSVSTIVARDINGDFAARIITANIIGNASDNLLKSGGILTGSLTLPAGSGSSPILQIGEVDIGLSSSLGNLQLSTNGTIGFILSNSGIVSITNLTNSGIVHNNASGDLSTSLIVGADITNTTITNNKLSSISSLNVPSYIVVRDINGDFSANTITANLNGTVTGTVIGHATLDLLLSGGILTGSLLAPIYFIGSSNTSLIENLGGLEFKTNGITYMSLSSAGSLQIHSLLTGILHSGNTGIITSSLITNADITVGTIANDKLVILSNPGLVLNSATTATNLNTINTIVARDSSGNFLAGNITQTSPSGITIYQNTTFAQAFGSPSNVATFVGTAASFSQRSNPNNDFSYNPLTGQITYIGSNPKWFCCSIIFSMQQQSANRTVEFWIQKNSLADPTGPSGYIDWSFGGPSSTTYANYTVPVENIQLATGNTIQLATRINSAITSINFRNIVYSLSQI